MKLIVIIIAFFVQFSIWEVYTSGQILQQGESDGLDIYDVVCRTEDGFEVHENCEQYWRCSNWEPILMNCSTGLYWNPAINECDFPGNVPSCPGGTRVITEPTTPLVNPDPSTIEPEVTTENPNPGDSTENPVESTENQGNSTESPSPGDSTENPGNSTENPGNSTENPNPGDTTSYPRICPPDGLERIPYPGNCTLYYFCANGDYTIEACAEGLLFDPITRNCRNAEEVECFDSSMTTPGVNPGICPEQGRHYLPYPGNCSIYIVCAEGIPFLEECGRGLLFDPILAKCNFPELVHCEWAIPTCPEEGVVYLPIQGSCVKYVFCLNGVPNYMACQDEMVFDPDKSLCVSKSEFDCSFAYALMNNFKFN